MRNNVEGRTWLAGLCLATVLGFVAERVCGSTEATPATTVAVVNGEIVTTRDLEKRLETLHGEVENTQRSSANVDRLLFRVVNDVLIAQEARSLGLHLESPIPETLERTRSSMARRRLEREEILERSQASDEEVEGLFDDRYRRATFHVLTAADLKGADKLMAALANGADIETLAREQSIDPYRVRGGRLEGIARKDLPFDISEAIFSLAPGQLAGPVRTDLGWSVLQAESFQPPDSAILPKVRRTLASLVRRRKAAAAREGLAQTLRLQHAVNVDEALVASIKPVRRADGRWTATSSEADRPVATIGEDLVITAEEYALALDKRWKEIRNEEAAQAAAPIILEGLITDSLLLAEAYARGYHEHPSVERTLRAQETQLVVPKYLSKVLAGGIEVSEEEKRAFYEEHKGEYRKPPRLQLGQITVATEAEAQSVAGTLRGGTDLAWLAAQRSTDQFKDKGGIKGWVTLRPGADPLNKALENAQPGEVLEPIGEEDAWIVYRVLAREELGLYSFEEISGNLREAVFQRKFAKVLDRFIKTIRRRSEIEIREDVLVALSLAGTVEPVAEETGHGQ